MGSGSLAGFRSVYQFIAGDRGLGSGWGVQRPWGYRFGSMLGLAAALVLGAGAAFADDKVVVPGTFSVSPMGAATYRVPIEVPPGTAGMQPNLALNYANLDGNGIVGMGWSLSGIGSVTRCAATVASEGLVHAIDYSTADRFCLNGQKLVAIAGTYGADGTEYRTEIESFTRVVSYGGLGAGPAWFMVWTRDGDVLEYGHTPDSAVLALGKGTVRAWSLNKRGDRSGNYYTVRYGQNQASGEAVPTRIDYTGNSTTGISPYAYTQFVYTARADATVTRTGGASQANSLLLTNIQTFTGAALVSDYRLTYERSPDYETARSRLISLARCAADNSCLPASTFTWTGLGTLPLATVISNAMNGTMAGWVPYTGSFFGTGRTDILWEEQDATQIATGNRVLWQSNGDGTFTQQPFPSQVSTAIHIRQNRHDDPDIGGMIDYYGTNVLIGNFSDNNQSASDVMLQRNGIFHLFKNNGDGTFNDYYHTQLFPKGVSYTTIPSNETTVVLDPVGLGCTFSPYNSVGGGHVQVGVFCPDEGRNKTFYISDPARTFSVYQEFIIPQPYNLSKTYDHFFVDFNGDGVTDVLLSETDASGNPTGTLIAGIGTGLAEFSYKPIGAPGSFAGYRPFFGNFGGSGKTDILMETWDPKAKTSTHQRRLLLGNGDGSFTEVPFPGPELGNYRIGLIGDFTGAGRDGVLLDGEDGNGISTGYKILLTPKGDGTWVSNTSYSDGKTANMRPIAGDFTGNGRTEIFWDGVTSPTDLRSNGQHSLYLSNGTLADTITRITDGLGNATGIAYSTLSRAGAPYRKATDALGTQMDVIGPMPIVSNVVMPDGVGGVRNFYYSYAGLKTDLTGRGMLGFRAVRMLDQAANSVVSSFYQQAFPYTGMMARSNQFAGAQLVSSVVNTYGSTTLTGAQAGSTRSLPLLQQSVTLANDLDGTALPGTTSTYQYDDYANMVLMQTVSDDGYRTNIYGSINNHPSNWLIGRPTSMSAVSTTPDGQVASHTLAIGYVAGTRLVAAQLDNVQTPAPPPPPVAPVMPPPPAPPAPTPIVPQGPTMPGDLPPTCVGTKCGGIRPIASGATASTPTTGPVTAGAIGLIATDPNAQTVLPNDPAVASSDSFTPMTLVAQPATDPTQMGPADPDAPALTIPSTITVFPSTGTPNLGGPATNAVGGTASAAIPAASGPQLRVDTVYDGFGNQVQITQSAAGEMSRVQTMTYDGRGQAPATMTNALGQTVRMSIDARFGTIANMTDPNGLTTTTTYDVFGRHRAVFFPDQSVNVSYVTYCDVSHECGTPHGYRFGNHTYTFQGGYTLTSTVTFSERDSFGRERYHFKQSSLANVFSFTYTDYDNLGRVLRTSQPFQPGLSSAVQYTNYSYDALGRVVKVVEPNGATSTMAYHGTTMVAANANAQTQQMVMNSRGQATAITDPLGNVTRYRYNALGKPVTVTDPVGNQVTSQYDTLGRLTQQVDPDLGSTSFAYDSFGHVVSQTDAKGQTITMAYDVLGRPTQRVEPDLTSTWTYDTSQYGIGRPAQATTNQGYVRTPHYDGLGREAAVDITIDGVTQSISTQYDVQGRAAGFTHPDGLGIHIGFNALDSRAQSLSMTPNATQVASGIGNGLVVRVDSESAAFAPTQITYGNTGITQFRYDEATGRLNFVGGSTTFTYSYDAIGNVTSRQDLITFLDGVGLETFQYDALNRLTQASIAGGTTKTYAYDAIGNLTNKSDTGSYTYGPTNSQPHAVKQINGSGPGAGTYGYDANGNQTSAPGRSVTWTSYDKPQTVASGSTSATFTYDDQHNRIKQVTPSGTHYYYNAEGISAEKLVGTNGTIEWRDYLSFTTGLVAVVRTVTAPNQTTQATIRYVGPDGQSSVGSLTNEGNAQMERDAYDAWGKRRNPNGTDDPAGALRSQITPGFTGQEEMDDLGLVNYNARLYDPKIGRFLSADTVTERGYTSQNYNRYAYARNNPVTFNDPSGHLGDCGESTNGQHTTCIDVPGNIPPPTQSSAQVAGILKELMRQFPNKTIFRQFVRGGAILGVKGRGGVPTPLQFVPISQTSDATAGVNDSSDRNGINDPCSMCHYPRLPVDNNNFMGGLGFGLQMSLFPNGRRFTETLNQNGMGFSIGFNFGEFFGAFIGMAGFIFTDGAAGRVLGALDRSTMVTEVGADSVVPMALTAGRLAEAEQLDALGAGPKVSFTPTQSQIDGAAFKVIVGDAKYTADGTPVGTIFDGTVGNGVAEIKTGTSPLTSSYQLRLQTYGALVNDTPYTIYTSRTINPTFSDYLTRFGVSVQPLPK